MITVLNVETAALADRYTPQGLKLQITKLERDANATEEPEVGALLALLRAEELQDIEAENERAFGCSADPVDDEESDRQADRYEKEIFGE